MIVTPTLKDLNVTDADQVVRLIQPQSEFLLTDARYPAFVGAWGVGKSMVGIGKGMKLSQEYRDNLGVIFRKEYTDLRDSTVKDFKRYTGISVNSSREAVVGSSVIMFRHIEELNSIQNMNLGWFLIEQAEELDTDDAFFTLFGRLRRKGVKHCGAIIANTKGNNWIKKLWKLGGLIKAIQELMEKEPGLFSPDAKVADMVALYEANTWDNAHNLDKQFLASLKILEKKKPQLYSRFVMNSWEDGASPGVIIQPLDVQAATKRTLDLRKPIRRLISIDVARSTPGAGDKSVFYAIENFRLLAKEEHETKDTMKLVGLAQLFARTVWGKEENPQMDAYAVDEIGVGGGVGDRLRELGKQVVFVNSAEREGVPAPYFNRRAEILGEGGKLFELGKVQILENDDDLIEQLSWTKWKPVNSKMILQAESKEDVQKTYGRSPDNADAALNGLWALPQVKIVVQRDGYAPDTSSSHRFNAATA